MSLPNTTNTIHPFTQNYSVGKKKEFRFNTAATPFQYDVKVVGNLKGRKGIEYVPYPWWRTHYFVEEDHDEACSREVWDFVEWLSPMPEEIKMRDDVTSRIKDVILSLWPEARVELYGSSVTDLCVPSSDIDMVVFDANTDRLEALFVLARELEKRGVCSEPEVITWAKVPIIKLRDIKSGGCLVDITFDSHSGLQNTQIIKEYIRKYPLVKPISLVVKYYLKQKYLNETWNGGIGSYTLVLMIISFIQVVL
eukprot:TRINITY_DN899_c0_g1_i2.p2 TRINITY_DN899_c0_g1~~TRINITY_DN899_c0_g1_i2.p2  ORF type:complete len:252 (-),score=48.24 TRINITY_DN899_c0_g1_i2:717-1472(-)